MRLFIAINLPKEIKKAIEGMVQEKIMPHYNREVRFLSSDNWHLTITFLGYQPVEATNSILNSIKETAESEEAPQIKLEKIIYAPPAQSKPRMIWLMGDKQTSDRLNKIKQGLEERLRSGGVRFRLENREFQSHLTLARFEPGIMNLPAASLFSEIDWRFKAETLDLMESHLKRTGAEYEVVSQFSFKPKL